MLLGCGCASSMNRFKHQVCDLEPVWTTFWVGSTRIRFGVLVSNGEWVRNKDARRIHFQRISLIKSAGFGSYISMSRLKAHVHTYIHTCGWIGLKTEISWESISKDIQQLPTGNHWKLNPIRFCHPFMRRKKVKKKFLQELDTRIPDKKNKAKRTAQTHNVHKQPLSKNTCVEKFNPAHFLNKLFKPS